MLIGSALTHNLIHVRFLVSFVLRHKSILPHYHCPCLSVSTYQYECDAKLNHP